MSGYAVIQARCPTSSVLQRVRQTACYLNGARGRLAHRHAVRHVLPDTGLASDRSSPCKLVQVTLPTWRHCKQIIYVC